MEQLERGQMGGSPEARDGRAVREGVSWRRPRRTFGFGRGDFGENLGAEAFQWFEE